MTDQLTARAAAVTIGFEAIVREWYLDSRHIGTWGIGVTASSGHDVMQYKDHPASIETCLEVFVGLLRKSYLPDVVKAFHGVELTEPQLAAALSFHYNTGQIGHTNWVGLVRVGELDTARQFLERHYTNNGTLSERRKAEADLFFDALWPPHNGEATVFPVLKPSYQPDFHHPERVDIMSDLLKAVQA